MEPIEQYFDNVKRSALVLKPQQPFLDWLITIDPTEKIEDLITESDVYLLPDYETVEEMKKWLRKNFDRIFSEQLNHWYVDDSLCFRNGFHGHCIPWFGIRKPEWLKKCR